MKSVYLIQSESGLYKIGVSKKPELRVKQLQTGNGEKIVLLHSYITNIPFLLEKSLKNIFAHYRVSGEWFRLPLEEEINFMATCDRIHKNLAILIENENYFL